MIAAGPQTVDETGRYLHVQAIGKHEYGLPSLRSSSTDSATRSSLPRRSRPRPRCLPGRAAVRRRLPRHHLWRLPLARAGGAAVDLPAAGARLPLAAAAAEGDRPEPSLHRSRVRDPRPRVQAGRRRAVRPHAVRSDRGWIPVFLFAMLFGLSMDYEVFLVSRMREEWDATKDNEAAVRQGLAKTGRLVTAAGLIMVAAFMGFVAGSIVGSPAVRPRPGGGDPDRRHDHPGLARAERDEDLRALELVAPEGVAKVFRVKPSPLESAPAPALRPAGKCRRRGTSSSPLTAAAQPLASATE